MPPKVVDGKDIERGKNFERICDTLFSEKSNEAIGIALGGYPEGTIRNWKKGGSIGNTAIYMMAKLGVSMAFLFRGEGEMISFSSLEKKSPTMKAGEQMISLKLYAILEEAHKALSVLSEKTASGAVEPDAAYRAVAEALDALLRAHGKPTKADKRRHSKTDTRDTGTSA